MFTKSVPSLLKVLSIINCACIICAQKLTQLPLDKFSTKTSYEWAHPENYKNYVKDELVSVKVNGRKCPASQMSFVARHGSRFPGDGSIERIHKLYNKINGVMNKDANPEFVNWPDLHVFPMKFEGLLAVRGKEEHHELGMRMTEKLSSLLMDPSHDLSSSRFSFRSSLSERAKESARAFFTGMLEARSKAQGKINLKSNNTLAKYYKECERYIQTVDDNPSAAREYEMYKNGARISKVGDKMASKLGVGKSTISSDDVELIYNTCAYELIQNKSSPWCTLIEAVDLPVLEYLGDLEEYYEYGYGHDINWQQSCVLLTNIFNHFKQGIAAIDKRLNNYHIGQFTFGHSGTVGSVMAALGLFKDDPPLKGDNYNVQGNRKFRTSQNICMAANIMFVVYKCDINTDITTTNNVHGYYLKVFVNEKAVVLPPCQNEACPVSMVVNHYSDLVEHCNFKKRCSFDHDDDDDDDDIIG